MKKAKDEAEDAVKEELKTFKLKSIQDQMKRAGCAIQEFLPSDEEGEAGGDPAGSSAGVRPVAPPDVGAPQLDELPVALPDEQTPEPKKED